MKGIILHGGHGTRLRPLTHTGPKQLLKIANKPMSQYALEDLRDAGINDIAIIIGDVYPGKVKEFYGDGSLFGVNITYVFQDQPKGIAHAIGLCKDFVGNDKFVVYLGDNILRKGLQSYVSNFSRSDESALILLSEVSNPSQFGVAKIENNVLTKIIEKPKFPPSNLAVIGVYFLTPEIFPILEHLKPSWRNELEITEALQELISINNSPTFDYVSGWWKDTGTPQDVLHANQLILETLVKNQTNIPIGDGSKISSSAKIIDPVLIGKNCVIGESVIIGPNVSIGNNSNLSNCQIKNSIIMDDCEINSKIIIENSIISDGTKITGDFSNKFSMLLGERSNINF
jgi:glucose-1-phosphate thymidylyltransferase